MKMLQRNQFYANPKHLLNYTKTSPFIEMYNLTEHPHSGNNLLTSVFFYLFGKFICSQSHRLFLILVSQMGHC